MILERKIPMIVCLIFFFCSSYAFGDADGKGSSTSPAQLPRVLAEHVQYVGAFRLPNEENESHSRRLGYGGNALGYNPVNNSLFVGGHSWYNLLCEVSIPDPSRAPSYEDLPLAELRQECADVTEGTLSSVKEDALLGGTLVYNGRLITSAWSYYDADCSQTRTHGATSGLSISGPGDFSGFSPMNAVARPRALAGYMTLIPEVWRGLFGGSGLTGIGGMPIIGCASSGLAAAVFDPGDVGVKNPIPATLLLYYPSPEEGLAKELFYWLRSTATRGVAFPEGTRSLLFVGVQGDSACYGTAEHCSDPCDGSKGVHSHPYHVKIWAFDANDVLKVKGGEASPWDIRPYASWTLPELERSGCAGIRGAAFDMNHSRLFIAPNYGEEPIIHVYEIATEDTTSPSAPGNLRFRE